MDKFIINGGKPLKGEIDVPCAKNSYLAILAACMLSKSTITLHKCPYFSDINKMLEILQTLGCSIERSADTIHIDCSNANNYEVPQHLAKSIRSSIFLMGAILGKLKKAKLSYPGGCDIGTRPIDLHLKGLRNLNVKITEKHGFIECSADNLKGGDVHLDYPSVGATENIMMAAVLAKGTTQIFNAAKEPEIVDLQDFINSMGGKVFGAGSSTITIVGVESLHSCQYTPISDRIVAGTYLIAAATCGGDVTITNANYQHIYSLITKIRNSSCNISVYNDKIRLLSTGSLRSFETIETMPYPGFATDLQAQAMVMQTVSKGTCIVSENLFETRYKHVPELIKMGADIVVKGKLAVVKGVEQLYGAEVTSHDLRGGAALTIAGLVAKGYTTLSDVYHIDRGYYKLEKALSKLGADIKRI